MDSARKDFFISYTSADEEWAVWIAHVLEEAGYSVVIQAWDFRPGSNFVIEMQKALQSSDRLIATLSPDYLSARFPRPEWAAVFAADPEGAARRLVPVMVRPCQPDGLLRSDMACRGMSARLRKTRSRQQRSLLTVRMSRSSWPRG
ncbi:toll/interleukin-1 receptor domain-containing protein [Dactylosporangium sp. NPDC049525]|uniref:toll/interleukin-1 receptor domain-containing protein n=1 Tax=Dactylosporangium sp. NPDC049525 TaxID=3154730 RepID=UPI00342D1825